MLSHCAWTRCNFLQQHKDDVMFLNLDTLELSRRYTRKHERQIGSREKSIEESKVIQVKFRRLVQWKV